MVSSLDIIAEYDLTLYLSVKWYWAAVDTFDDAYNLLGFKEAISSLPEHPSSRRSSRSSGHGNKLYSDVHSVIILLFDQLIDRPGTSGVLSLLVVWSSVYGLVVFEPTPSDPHGRQRDNTVDHLFLFSAREPCVELGSIAILRLSPFRRKAGCRMLWSAYESREGVVIERWSRISNATLEA